MVRGTYEATEIHYGVGIGRAVVTCCNKWNQEVQMFFTKVCAGGAIGVSAGGGVVIFNDKGCTPSAYTGWFFELGAALKFKGYGPGVGVDIGINDINPNGKRLRDKIPFGFSGTNEGGFSFSPSTPSMRGGLRGGAKITWCRYRYDKRIVLSNCCKNAPGVGIFGGGANALIGGVGAKAMRGANNNTKPDDDRPRLPETPDF